MLYLVYGTEKEKARAKAHSILDAMKTKQPEAEFFKIEADGFSISKLQELVYSQGLFSPKYIVFLDNVFDDKEAKEAVMDILKDMGSADTGFVILEAALDQKTAKSLEKHSSKVYLCGESKGKKDGEGFNVFSLAEALGRKDKKELWVLYQKARREFIEPEAIHGILLWKMRAQAEKGNQTAVKNIRSLTTLYHESRRGKNELDLAIEQFILSL